MWFKKSELKKQIEAYGKDSDYLLEFARFVKKDRLEDISLDDVKAYYTGLVEPQNSKYIREDMMKAVRKFFREYRGNNILSSTLISDNPLKSVEVNASMQYMQKTVKKKRGRPANTEMINKVKVLREQGGLTFRQIAAAIGEDVRQAHLWYTASKKTVS